MKIRKTNVCPGRHSGILKNGKNEVSPPDRTGRKGFDSLRDSGGLPRLQRAGELFLQEARGPSWWPTVTWWRVTQQAGDTRSCTPCRQRRSACRSGSTTAKSRTRCRGTNPWPPFTLSWAPHPDITPVSCRRLTQVRLSPVTEWSVPQSACVQAMMAICTH